MKGKKIIIILIIINILTIGIIYNLIKKDYLNNEKIIVKAMTETEYENSIKSLNTSHEEYANYIEEGKKKIASALTEKGVETSNEETLETMANNIKSIKESGYSKSQTLTGSIAVPGASAYAPFSITFNELSKIDGYLNDMTFNGTNRAVINSMSVNGNQLNFTCTNGNSTSTYKLNYTITAFEF